MPHAARHANSANPANPQVELLRWDHLPLPEVAGRLFDHGVEAGADGEVDLSGIAVVVPGRRAERLLLWHLIERADAAGATLVPPRVVAAGAVADLVAPPVGRVATPLERESALVAALADCRERAAKVFPVLGNDERDAATAIATLLRSMEDRLDVVGLGVRDAVAHARAAERWRWETVVEIVDAAAAILRDLGLDQPWTVQRTSTLSTAAPVSAIVLALVIEMPSRARRLLAEAVADGLDVTAYVHAPEEMRDAFDEFGLLRCGAWTKREVGVDPACVRVAEGALDAAEVAIGAALRESSQCAADEIVIGLVDQSFGASLRMAGDWANVRVRLADGRPLSQTQSWRLIDALAQSTPWIDRGDSVALPGVELLTRLPAIAAWLHRSGAVDGPDDAPAIIDRVLSERQGWRDDAVAAMITSSIAGACAPLRGDPRPASAWAEPIRAVLSTLLSAAPAEHPDEDAVSSIVGALEQWSRIPDALAGDPIEADAALAQLAEQLEQERVPEPVRSDTLEALGWLELHADDAPALVLLGVHEGVVPAGESSHPLLTPRMVRELGLPDDAHRLSRDAYLMEAIVQGRRSVTVIVARRSAGGDPLLPSRLLLRGAAASLPSRVLELIDGDRAIRVDRPRGLPSAAQRSAYVVPPVTPTPPPAMMSVTDFSRYIACPYRYRLQRLLRLQAFDEVGGEFDAMEFGTLMHDVLRDFANDEALRDSTDPNRIAEALSRSLDERVAELVGAAPSPAIAVQCEHVRARLVALAEWQARHRAEGWRIDEVEWSLPVTTVLDIPAEGDQDAQPPMPIRGRIDRIDRHPKHGVLIIDYKTSALGSDPQSTHLCSKRSDGLNPDDWQDLQLPLYRHLLATTLDRPVPVHMAHVQLPRDVNATSLVPFEISDEAQAVAIGVARRIVRAIRANEFPLSESYDGHDEFAAICQADAFVADSDASTEGDS